LATADASYVSRLLVAAEELGHKRATILARFGLTEEELAEPEGRVPSVVVYKLFLLLAESSEDPWIGATVARGTSPEIGGLGVVTYTCGRSATLGRAFERLARYLAIIDSAARFVQRPLAEGIVVGIDTPTEDAFESPQGTLFGLAMILQSVRSMTGQEIQPREVRLKLGAVDDLAGGVKAFGTDNFVFNAEENAIVLDGAVLEMPLATADPSLAAILDGYATRLLDGLAGETPDDDDILQRVRRTIIELLAEDASLPAVAEHLKLAERTLQRRLKEEGRSFQELLDEVRQSLAERYVCDEGLTQAQIALLLGYSDVTAFSRAFKRWFGKSPSKFKASAQG
jgi:AraC-like DNA-binding protein